MTDQSKNEILTLVDENGNELTVIERMIVSGALTDGLAMIHFEYKTLEGEVVPHDGGTFFYDKRHYTLRAEV